MVVSILKEEGFNNIATAKTIKKHLLWQITSTELAILDVMLCQTCSFSLMEQLKQSGEYPVLFLTARGRRGQIQRL